MPASASFYLIEERRIADLVAAATPESRGWFRAPVDRFPDALAQSTRQLERFDAFSSSIFESVEDYLEERVQATFDSFGIADSTRRLSDARGASWLVVSAAGARKLLDALERAQVRGAPLREFIVAEFGPDEIDDLVNGAEAAGAALAKWLGQVSSGYAGIFVLA